MPRLQAWGRRFCEDLREGARIILKEDIIGLILQAEKEYHNTVRQAVAEAEQYADDCKEKQGAYIESLKEDWHLFEKGENEAFEAAFARDEQKTKKESAKSRARLRLCQEKMIGVISERLKEEVLSFYYGNR